MFNPAEVVRKYRSAWTTNEEIEVEQAVFSNSKILIKQMIYKLNRSPTSLFQRITLKDRGYILVESDSGHGYNFNSPEGKVLLNFREINHIESDFNEIVRNEDRVKDCVFEFKNTNKSLSEISQEFLTIKPLIIEALVSKGLIAKVKGKYYRIDLSNPL